MTEEFLRAQIAAAEEILAKARADLAGYREKYDAALEILKKHGAPPDIIEKELADLRGLISRTETFIQATLERIKILQDTLAALLEEPEEPEPDEDIQPPDEPPPVVPGEEAKQIGFIGGLLGKFGKLGAIKEDAAIAAGVTAPIQGLLASLGLTPEALEALKTSPLNRELAAQVATGVATAAQVGLGLVYSLGVLLEVGSLGQVDTVVDMIDNILVNLGIDEIIRPLFTAPSYAALTVPTRQYWMSVFKPTVPEIEDLRTMAVREAFPVETREEQFAEMARWGAYHGLDEFWAERYLRAGYVRMDVDTAILNYYWRLWDDETLKRFLAIADIHPDDHEAILNTIWRSPTRYERRHGFIMGVYDEEALEEYFHRDGLSDADAKTATAAMTAYALNAERNAVARAAGRIYRETLEELAKRIGDLEGNVASSIEYLERIQAARREEGTTVTQADVDAAEEAVEAARSELGAWKRKAGPVREKAEAELREELKGLHIVGERLELWVRRYAMEARVATRPWELFEEYGMVLEAEEG